MKLNCKPTNEPTCKGVFFKLYTSAYLSTYNSIEVKKSLRVLKRKSCKGCSECEWIWETLKDDINETEHHDYIGNLVSGCVYTLRPNFTWDYEYGHDFEGFDFIRVKENE